MSVVKILMTLEEEKGSESAESTEEKSSESSGHTAEGETSTEQGSDSLLHGSMLIGHSAHTSS